MKTTKPEPIGLAAWLWIIAASVLVAGMLALAPAEASGQQEDTHRTPKVPHRTTKCFYMEHYGASICTDGSTR